jgi:hypothetical protein
MGCATAEFEMGDTAASWFDSELTTTAVLSDRFRKKTSLYEVVREDETLPKVSGAGARTVDWAADRLRTFF